jgi:hypothetical protein
MVYTVSNAVLGCDAGGGGALVVPLATAVVFLAVVSVLETARMHCSYGGDYDSEGVLGISDCV